jgi:hypothetical protein
MRRTSSESERSVGAGFVTGPYGNCGLIMTGASVLNYFDIKIIHVKALCQES